MVKIKCKVMLSVLSYFILNFVFVYSFDIKNVQHIRKRHNRPQNGMCDLYQQKVSFNYNELYKNEGYTVTSDNKIFYLNICGYTPQCGRNIAVCYKNNINATQINNIGAVDEISYPYKAIRYKINKKKKTTISFICDRHVQEPLIIHDKNSLYNFKFITSKACNPKPTECVFIGEKYNYNISYLNNKNNWEVKNIPNNSNYKIYLNICGKFNSIPNLKTNSDCFYDGTQICLVYNNGNSKNLGVFSDPFYFKDNSISLSITGGSLCNSSNSILTNIKFICSIDELGPVLVSNSKCEYNINWMTPTICPHHLHETFNCQLKDSIFGFRKMKFKPESLILNNTFTLNYNICDRINCNGDENAHFCLVNVNNNRETIIGRSNDTKLISNDGLLTSTYWGDNCTSSDQIKHRVDVTFNCDYTKNKRADIRMGDCVTNVTIHTNEACTDPEPQIPEGQCTTFVNKSGVMYYYNISRLMLTDRNYEIQDEGNPNLIYVLNVCQPILFRPETHCDPTAIVCMMNYSVGDIYERSKTLGHYGLSKLTVLQNDSLLLQFDGGMCSQKIGNKYLTMIEFICDYNAQDSKVKLVSKTDCKYYFKWETQYACPLTNDTSQIKSIYESTTAKNIIHENIQESSVLKMEQSQTHMSSSSDPTVDSRLIVNKVDTVTESPKILSTSLIVPIDIDIKVSNTSVLFVKNCTFEDFNMYKLPRNINITSKTGKLYYLNICNLPKTQDCKLQNCLSKLKMDVSNKFIEMDFHGKTKCDDGYYNSVVYMKCSEKSAQPSVIKEEACGVELEWKNSAVCALLQEKPKIYPNDGLESQKSGHITTIIISVFVLLLILLASVFISIYFWRKRQVYRSSSPSCLNRCDYTRVKDSAKIV